MRPRCPTLSRRPEPSHRQRPYQSSRKSEASTADAARMPSPHHSVTGNPRPSLPPMVSVTRPRKAREGTTRSFATGQPALTLHSWSCKTPETPLAASGLWLVQDESKCSRTPDSAEPVQQDCSPRYADDMLWKSGTSKKTPSKVLSAHHHRQTAPVPVGPPHHVSGSVHERCAEAESIISTAPIDTC